MGHRSEGARVEPRRRLGRRRVRRRKCACERVIQARIEALVDFLVRSLPKVTIRGPAAWGSPRTLRGHLADEGQLGTHLGTVYGVDIEVRALTAGLIVLTSCFHPRHIQLIAIHRHKACAVNAQLVLGARGRLGGRIVLITICRL